VEAEGGVGEAVGGAAGGGGEERLSWDQLLWSLWWQPPRRLKRRVSITVAVDEEVAAKARELARARGVSLSALVREAIAQYVAAGSPAAPRQPDPAAAGSRSAPPPPPPAELQAALLERLDRIERRLGEVERLLRAIPAAAGSAPAPPAPAPPEPELPDFVRGNPWLSVIAGRGG
jgi:hypothetical protein